MKVVLLDTGRGVNPDTIRMWRENLELLETDEVALMAWQPPREPLPVTEHYVFGPKLSLKDSEPRHLNTLADVEAAQADAAVLRDEDAGIEDEDADPDSAEIGGDDSPVSESDLAGQMGEAMAVRRDRSASWGPADSSGQNSLDAAGNGRASGPSNAAHQRVAGLPVYHPARLAHAARWRSRKAVRAGRRAAGAAKRSLKQGTNPIARAAQHAISTRNGSIAMQFAIALSRSKDAAELFRSADLVFPVDARSQRGAWLLARANPGPDVMVGYPAAIRALNRRRQAQK